MRWKSLANAAVISLLCFSCASEKGPETAEENTVPDTPVADAALEKESLPDADPENEVQIPGEPPWGEGPRHPFSPAITGERDGNILRVELIAEPKVHDTAFGSVAGYAYNDLNPGPTIRGVVGDELEVVFTNGLLTPTTIHWHGAEVPWEMDGSTWEMAPILPGETYVYRFPLTKAGTFWYHPHFDTDKQVDLGLYGMLVVEEPEEPAADWDIELVFDSFEEANHMDMTQHGHFHDPMLVTNWLVNGERNPIIPFPAGTTVRGRLLNASNGGYLELTWPGMRVIGREQGLLPQPEQVETLLLVPGDRAEVEWTLGSEPIEVRTWPHTMMGGRAYGEPETLVQLIPEGDEETPDGLSWGTDEVAPTPDPPYTDLVYVLAGSPRTGRWLINGEEFPNITPYSVPKGEVRIIEVRNLSPSQHPFHMHGVTFEVLSVNGTPPAQRQIQDTINLNVYETVRIRVENTNPGLWMVHCHILGHAHQGMMTVLEFE